MNDYKLQVFSEDVDYSGVVYHANYLKFIERARTSWLNDIGSGLEAQKNLGVYFTIREIDIQYIKPARLDDTLNVVSQIKARGKTQLHFHQEIYNLSNENIQITKANVYVVCVNKNFRPLPIPDTILEVISHDN